MKLACLGILFVITLMFNPAMAKPQTKTDAVKYNYKRGFYTNSFQLELSSKTNKSIIRYTIDGSKPSQSNGQFYTAPILINSTTMVRSYAFANNREDSKIKTHTYIFPEKVIRQKNKMLEDYGVDYSERTSKVFWTEEMDPEIVDADEYKDEIIQGLLDIPTLSIVMNKEDLWSKNGIHWGKNLSKKIDAFERECSVEMIYPEGYKEDSFRNWQEDAGIKIQGGGGRSNFGCFDHKQSFSIVFKKIYGSGKLKNEIFADAPHGESTLCGKYDKIVLRAGHDNSWGVLYDRENTVYTRDQFGRDLQILMSGFGSHGTFVHLYLNGKYWGLYNPYERPDNCFMANHLGGKSEDYFYAKGKEHYASDKREGEYGQSNFRFYSACNKDYSDMPFNEMQKWVMVDQSIATFLVYGYINPGEGNQYYYGNNNNPPGPVVWIPWDVEYSHNGRNNETTSLPNADAMISCVRIADNGLKVFWSNIDFRMRFSDLVYKYYFNDGVLTDENAIKAWDKLTNYIHKAIICESARWGDERSAKPMDRDTEWDKARVRVRNDFNGRAELFISQLQEAGYFSTIPAPMFYLEDLEITSNTISTRKKLSITIKNNEISGTTYYTSDESDPRTWDLKAAVSPKAIEIIDSKTTIKVKRGTIVKARTLYKNEWSPLHELKIIKN